MNTFIFRSNYLEIDKNRLRVVFANVNFENSKKEKIFGILLLHTFNMHYYLLGTCTTFKSNTLRSMILHQQVCTNTGSIITSPKSWLSIQPRCHSIKRACGLNLFNPRINCCEASFTSLSNHCNTTFYPSIYVHPFTTSFRNVVRSISIALLLWSSFHLSFLEPVHASEEIVVPACIAEKCGKELTSCFADSKCAEGVKCFMKCAAQDSFGVNERGLCQAKCYDVHEAPMVRKISQL